MFIPDTNFSIPDPGSASENLSMVSKLSEISSGLFIPDPDPDFLPIPDPGVKNAPDPGSLIRNTVSDNFLEKKLKKIFIFS